MKLASAILAGIALAASACEKRLPGQPANEAESIRPDQVTSFDALYATNCSGCHGAEGRGGAAQALSDPLYLALADDAAIRRVVRAGVRRTPMPAFAQSAGGMLTDAQIEAIVAGIRGRWAKPESFRGVNLPPYASFDGDARRGADVYAARCASCHGPNGTGSERASSIVDGSFLALVSNQSLRTTVIAGRPELGHPDFRGSPPGRPMSAEEVSDVVAWLTAQRPEVAGQPYPAVRTAGGEHR